MRTDIDVRAIENFARKGFDPDGVAQRAGRESIAGIRLCAGLWICDQSPFGDQSNDLVLIETST